MNRTADTTNGVGIADSNEDGFGLFLKLVDVLHKDCHDRDKALNKAIVYIN